MERVFIYWDNSNIYISAKEFSAEREGEGARARVRIHFRNLLRLAHADRPIQRAVAVGSIPPELRHVWNRMENEGVEVQLFERGAQHGQEQGVDQALQSSMLRDMADHNGDPGIVVLLTGDGKGFADGVGFHADLERMHRKKWRIEVLSWMHSCNRRMKEWAVQNGKFIALDDFSDSITFLEPPQPGRPVADPRDAVQVDLSRRPM
ncbi:MAG: NYN domain-containing protein [Nitrospira sp.]|nr:NYN domain-containing protein [Nitrospira sp.]